MVKTPFILRPLAVLLFSAVLFACSDDSSKTNLSDDAAKIASTEESAKTKSACDDGSDPVCDICNPAEELTWLHDEIADIKASEIATYFYVIQGTYNGQTVFAVGNCCPFCNTLPPVVKGCDGVAIESATIQAVTDKKVIWQGETACNI